MNRKKHEKEAQRFLGENDCYIHAEMKGGNMELIVSGQMLGIIHAVSKMVERLSELTGQSFDDTLQAVKLWELAKMETEDLEGERDL